MIRQLQMNQRILKSTINKMQDIKYKVQLNKIAFGIIFLMLFSFSSIAQRDTSRRQVVDITSSYKPVLRNASKLNIAATQLQADTSKLKMKYNIPVQNLFYSYQPVSLRPLAYDQDTLQSLGGYNYIKAGIGNYTTPYVSARVNLMDTKKAIVNVYGDYISSKGKIKYQDYTGLNLKATGSYFTEQNEVYGSVSSNFNNYYLYGYDHSLFNYSRTAVLQQYANFSTTIGVRNITTNDLGIDYNPSVKVSFFSLKDKVGESSVVLNLPAEKKINDQFVAKLALSVDYTSYKTKGYIPDDFKLNNTIVQISPEVIYKQPLFILHAGIIPVVDNKSFYVLPNVYGEVKITNKTFLVQAGLVGKITKNYFSNLSDINPYLEQLSSQNNTRETEIYGGLKTMVGKHFNFTAKAGFVHFNNFQLYRNDTTDFKSFSISNEPNLDAFRIHADISYLNRDKFSFTSGITINQYAGMGLTRYVWGNIPLEVTAAMRYQYSEKLFFKSDLYAFVGAPYLLKNNTSKNLPGGFDLSAGAEYMINSKFCAWLDLNNICNNKYQRWYNYPVYGINVLAGVKYKF
jgi:hypothetical protein